MARQYVITMEGQKRNAMLGDALGGQKMWRWNDGEPKVFTVISPFRLGTPLRKSGIATAPTLLDVTDVSSGNKETILAGKVLVSILTENYPDDGYVGRTFQAVQGPPPAGKRYKSMEVREVTLTDNPAEEPAEEPAKKTRKK